MKIIDAFRIAASALALVLTACPGDDSSSSDSGSSTTSSEQTGSTTTPVSTTVDPTTGSTPTTTMPPTTGPMDTTTGPMGTTDGTTTDQTSGSTGDSGTGGVCGDGVADPGEDCDGDDLGGADCVSQGFDGGTLACDRTCAFDTSACTTFACDDAAIMMGDCPEADTMTCTCQACDPGNGCEPTEDCVCPDCAMDAFCGNPANCMDDGLCDPYNEGCMCADCVGHPACPPPAVCGDGMIGLGEACDGVELNGEDCTTLGYAGGTLACDGMCAFDTSMCMAGPFMCADVAADMNCIDADPMTCTCQACDPGNGCEASEDCVCPDCAMDGFCGDPGNCTNDGVCDPYLEGCVCPDCAAHPLCP